MKKVLLLNFLLIISFYSKAYDILALHNKKTFCGKIVDIAQNVVKFKVKKTIFLIPQSDIQFIIFEKANKRILRNAGIQDTIKCEKGYLDAEYYHGRNIVYFIGGMFFIGIPIAYEREATPQRGRDTKDLSKNQELFTDPEYLECYKKQARQNNVGSAWLGLASWLIIAPLIYINVR